MIKIVFFDGDGTLWYPKATQHTKKPHWIYSDLSKTHDYKHHLILTPNVKSTLYELRKRKILTVVVSTHPQKPKVADVILREKVTHFGLEDLFDEVHTARNVVTGKGDVIVKVLERLGIPKKSAIMIGDSYRWDYMAAKKVGVKGLIMDTRYLSEYAKTYPGAGRIKRKIKTVGDVFSYIDKW